MQMGHIHLTIEVICVELQNSADIIFLMLLNMRLGNHVLEQEEKVHSLKTITQAVSAHCIDCIQDHYNKDAKYHLLLSKPTISPILLKRNYKGISNQTQDPAFHDYCSNDPTWGGDAHAFRFMLYLRSRRSDQMQLLDTLTSSFVPKGEMAQSQCFQLCCVAQKWTN